ncbi:MAG TPA: NTP transferase domain-containing protein [Phycisphaerales bacterium]|nr:NTP transferase domain-containing protein [Phycisphaerales bacterium]
MRSLSAIILAAGKGTRMNSDLPKVAHRAAGLSMVEWVADACAAVGCSRIVIVVGHRQEVVRDLFANRSGPGNIEFAIQDEQHGTGHAVMCAESLFAAEKSAPGHDVFVLAGDGPLIRPATLKQLLERHRATNSAATLATSVITDPTGYGRIFRDAAGRFSAIVEHKNASPEQLKINEINPSYYCFDVRELFESLKRVGRNPVSNEYYITDVPELLLKAGKRVEVIPAVPPEDVLSINTLEELAKVDAIFRSRAAVPAGRVA